MAYFNFELLWKIAQLIIQSKKSTWKIIQTVGDLIILHYFIFKQIFMAENVFFRVVCCHIL